MKGIGGHWSSVHVIAAGSGAEGGAEPPLELLDAELPAPDEAFPPEEPLALEGDVLPPDDEAPTGALPFEALRLEALPLEALPPEALLEPPRAAPLELAPLLGVWDPG